jgi:hypothetical protein
LIYFIALLLLGVCACIAFSAGKYSYMVVWDHYTKKRGFANHLLVNDTDPASSASTRCFKSSSLGVLFCIKEVSGGLPIKGTSGSHSRDDVNDERSRVEYTVIVMASGSSCVFLFLLELVRSSGLWESCISGEGLGVIALAPRRRAWPLICFNKYDRRSV